MHRKEPIPFFPSPSPRDFNLKPHFHQNGEPVRRLIVYALPRIDFEKVKKLEDQKKKWHSGRKQKLDKLVSCGLKFAFKLATVIAAQFEWHLAGCSYHYKFPWSPAIVHYCHR